jgi:hypothetical protein
MEEVIKSYTVLLFHGEKEIAALLPMATLTPRKIVPILKLIFLNMKRK